MKYRISLDIEVMDEAEKPLTESVVRSLLEEGQDPTHYGPIDIRRVVVSNVEASPQGDRVRAILVHAHRGDLAERIWENSAGDAVVPWVDGITPESMDEVRLVLNAFGEARGRSGATDKQVAEIFQHWSDECSKITGGRAVSDAPNEVNA